MRQFGCLAVGLPYFDALVRFSRDESCARQIKLQRHDPILRLLQRPRLHLSRFLLEAIPRAVIPKTHPSVVSPRNQDAILLHRHGVPHNGGGSSGAGWSWDGHFVQEPPVLALPFANGRIGRRRTKGAFVQSGRCRSQGADALGVVRQGGKAFAGGQVPQFDGGVVRARGDLGVRWGGEYGRNGMLVPRQDVHGCFGAHVPHTRDRVAARRDENVQRRVQGQAVHARQVSVVMSNDLIRFQIPAFDHFVFSRRKEIGMSFGKGQSSDGTDMSREGQEQGVVRSGARLGQIPYFDGSIGRSRRKHGIVGWINGNRTDPAQMRRQHSR